MTRAERFAAGWRESWLVRSRDVYSTGVREWGGESALGMWVSERKNAFRFTTYSDAAGWITWFCEDAHGLYAYSLRSRGDFDVSAVAKKFGGGGHRNAAGFTSALHADALFGKAGT